MGKIVVVGSSNTDMIIQVPRLPGPGETVLGGAFGTAAGGKGANQAVAAARAGGEVALVTCVGRDDLGQRALSDFERSGLDTSRCVVTDAAPSGVAQITVSATGENSIAVAPGANGHLLPRHVEVARELIAQASVLLLQLEIPLDTVCAAARLAAEVGCRVVLNPAPATALPAELHGQLDLITPNESEAEILTGIAVRDHHSAARAAEQLHGRGVAAVLITRGRHGVFFSSVGIDGQRRECNWPAFAVEAVDTTAAGDVFNGCLAVGLAAGTSLEEALRFAQAGAAISVQVLGAQSSAPGLKDIQHFLDARVAAVDSPE